MNSIDSWFHKNEYYDGSSSDCDSIDSEIEFHLYSQLHYGIEKSQDDDKAMAVGTIVEPQIDKHVEEPVETKESFLEWFKKTASEFKEDNASPGEDSSNSAVDSDTTIEEWQIIDESASSDSNVPTIHMEPSPVINLKEIDESKDTSTSSEDLWRVSHYADNAKIHNTYVQGRYYMEGSRIRCKNCDEVGHMQKNCPKPRKQSPCYMCGELGHNSKKCTSWYELQEWPERKTCKRCGQYGHRYSKCPDNWRRYHATTKHGILQTHHRKISKRRYCSICAQEGHFNYKCDSIERNRFVSVHSMMIYDYDKNNHDGLSDGGDGIRKRKNSNADDVGESSKKMKKQNVYCDNNLNHNSIKFETNQPAPSTELVSKSKKRRLRMQRKKLKNRTKNLNGRSSHSNNKSNDNYNKKQNQNFNSKQRRVFWS